MARDALKGRDCERDKECQPCDVKAESEAIQVLVEAREEVSDKGKVPGHANSKGQAAGSAVAQQPARERARPESGQRRGSKGGKKERQSTAD